MATMLIVSVTTDHENFQLGCMRAAFCIENVAFNMNEV